MQSTVIASPTRCSLRRVRGSLNIVCLHVIFLSLLSVHAQTDWPIVGHDPHALRYSPLKQIDVHNVASLAPAWTFQLKPSYADPDHQSPILYSTQPGSAQSAVSFAQVQTQLPDGKGRELVQRVCNSCHSVDLITTHR